MNEIWCVIECSSDGEIFQPDFFTSKEEAAAFIEEETKECLFNMADLPGADRMTDIVDGNRLARYGRINTVGFGIVLKLQIKLKN